MTAININDAIDTSVIIIVHQIFAVALKLKLKLGNVQGYTPRCIFPNFQILERTCLFIKSYQTTLESEHSTQQTLSCLKTFSCALQKYLKDNKQNSLLLAIVYF